MCVALVVALVGVASGHLSRLPGPFSNAHLSAHDTPGSTCELAFAIDGFSYNVTGLQLPTGACAR